MAIEKLTSVCELAADGLATRVSLRRNEVAHVDLDVSATPPRRWLGTGTFVWAEVGDLAELTPMLRRGDQTVTHFGFSRRQLSDFVRRCADRAPDRLVPVGRALECSTVWDGVDLLREFTRITTVDGG
ncbi:hypothetical protein [Micromonospora olivasterospora]